MSVKDNASEVPSFPEDPEPRSESLLVDVFDPEKYEDYQRRAKYVRYRLADDVKKDILDIESSNGHVKDIQREWVERLNEKNNYKDINIDQLTVLDLIDVFDAIEAFKRDKTSISIYQRRSDLKKKQRELKEVREELLGDKDEKKAVVDEVQELLQNAVEEAVGRIRESVEKIGKLQEEIQELEFEVRKSMKAREGYTKQYMDKFRDALASIKTQDMPPLSDLGGVTDEEPLTPPESDVDLDLEPEPAPPEEPEREPEPEPEPEPKASKKSKKPVKPKRRAKVEDDED